jgi:hypothetical protein
MEQVTVDLVAMVHDVGEHRSLSAWTGKTSILNDTLLIVVLRANR